MSLDLIRIKGLRCLAEVELELSQGRNYVYGPNGAGKTSILEGMFILGRGRSFRTRQVRKLVRRGDDGFTVYGEIAVAGRRHRLGVGYLNGRLDKRIDGEAARSTAALVELLPVHVIDPGVHDLIQGGPSERRRFLDWGVFHVEPSYLEGWKRYRRELSQRNAALKHGARAEIQTWTKGLAQAGELVHVHREAYVARLGQALTKYGHTLLERPLTVDYLPGWRSGWTLAEALGASAGRDTTTGTTDVGPHRADLVVRLDGTRVAEEASRGQQKLAAAALVLAQAELRADARGARDLLLVDDPAAELDGQALRRLLTALDDVPAQLVLTALDRGQLRPSPGFPVFHVEHGRVQAV